MGNRPIAKPLPTQKFGHKQRPRAGFEPNVPAWQKTVRVLDRTIWKGYFTEFVCTICSGIHLVGNFQLLLN